MAVSPKTELTVNSYRSSTPPSATDVANLSQYVLREIANLQRTVTDLVNAAPQATDVAPKNPLNGMLRYAEGAWATTLGAVGLYVYKAGVWTRIV